MSGGDAGSRRRVLLIGLDSADADLIDEWMDAGYLPTFARLKREGLHTRLGTTAEVMHVSAWPSLYTGTTPGHHGLYHAYQIRAGEQVIHRTDPTTCGRPPFWKFLDDAGRRCVIFDAFMDYPLPGYRGVQVHDYGTWTWFGEPGSSPPGMLSDIKRRFGPYPAPEHSDFVQVPDDTAGFAGKLIAGTQVKARIVQSMVRADDWDFLFVTFGEPHGAGHYLWHVGDPEYPTASGRRWRASGSRRVRRRRCGHRRDPRIVGRPHHRDRHLRRRHGTELFGLPPDAGDAPSHGHFYAGSVGGGAQSTAPKRGLLASIRQAIPLELRQSVTRCLPRSMRYKMSMKWINSGIDWPRSKLFCIPNSNEGYFRVNLRGREPQGIVSPGAEYEDLIASLSQELAGLRNPVNGAQAAERVTEVDRVFPGERRGDLPDAVISWNLDARVTDELQAPTAGLIRGKAGHAISPFYNGNHRASAFVFARGPEVAKGGLDNGHILDFAPTLLSMFGVESPGYFEGRDWRWSR